jgi:hypothetical protein
MSKNRTKKLKRLQEDKRNWRKRNRALSGVSLLALILTFTVDAKFLFLLIVPLLFTRSFKKQNELGKLKAGQEGEDNTEKLLQTLPGDYKVFREVSIKHEGKNVGIDFVVVGSNGVFLIDSVFMSGIVVGEPGFKQWHSRNNGIPNPIKKGKWQAHVLSSKLKQDGINVFVHPIVFLSNPNGIFLNEFLNVKGEACFNIHDNGEMNAYIKSIKKAIPENQKKELCEWLEKKTS